MKDTRRECLSCSELKALSQNLGVCSSCRLRLFDDGGLAIMSMYKLYGFNKNTLEEMNNSGALTPEVNADGNWRYSANTVKWYFVKNSDKLLSLINNRDTVQINKKGAVRLGVVAGDSLRRKESPKQLINDIKIADNGIDFNEAAKDKNCLRCKNKPIDLLTLSLCSDCSNKVFKNSYISRKDVASIYSISEEDLVTLDKNGLLKARSNSGRIQQYSKSSLMGYLVHRYAVDTKVKTKPSDPSILCEIKVTLLVTMMIKANDNLITLCEKVRGFHYDKFTKELILPKYLFDILVVDILQGDYSRRASDEFSVEAKVRRDVISIKVINSGEHYRQQESHFNEVKIRKLFSDYKALSVH